MAIKKSYTKLQKISLVVGSTYLFFICLYITLLTPNNIPSNKNSSELKDKKAGVEITDFERTSFKNGKMTLKVFATLTTYDTSLGEAKLSSPIVYIYDKERKSAPPTEIRASSAKIISRKEGEVESALLEGNVVITKKEQGVLTTNTAEYSSISNIIHCPEYSTILGQGYEINGNKMDIDLNSDSSFISGNVSSMFQSLKKVPIIDTNNRKKLRT